MNLAHCWQTCVSLWSPQPWRQASSDWKFQERQRRMQFTHCISNDGRGCCMMMMMMMMTTPLEVTRSSFLLNQHISSRDLELVTWLPCVKEEEGQVWLPCRLDSSLEQLPVALAALTAKTRPSFFPSPLNPQFRY